MNSGQALPKDRSVILRDPALRESERISTYLLFYEKKVGGSVVVIPDSDPESTKRIPVESIKSYPTFEDYALHKVF